MRTRSRSHSYLNPRDSSIKTIWHLPQTRSSLALADGTLVICTGIGSNYLGSDCPSISVCPGRELADASLWITFALALATMNIGKPFNADGNELKQEDIVYTPTVIRWERIYKASASS